MSYVIGIDLGTTHCVMSCIDLEQEYDFTPVHQVAGIPQWAGAGELEERKQLPSFLYQYHESELSEEDLNLPWSDEKSPYIVGEWARQLGSKTPLRLVSSAKSWLCNGGIDAREPILPPNSPEEVIKISPFAATQHYLRYLKQVWDHQNPEHPFNEQDVVITIPASFDPAARELSAEAARSVGIQNLTLIEEPQAAVYNWVLSNPNWRDQLSVNDILLVVDIGGGTTDFSLIEVKEQDGELGLERIAVGNHILLGGDNMDLALAYALKAQLAKSGQSLQSWQVQGLVHGCRSAKEQLMQDDDLEQVEIAIPSRGSKLLGKTLRVELKRAQVDQLLVDGFFPMAHIEDHPAVSTKAALSEIGLPYASDPAITRHLAAFLSRQAEGDDFVKPNKVLLNGGVLKAAPLVERLMQVLNNWLMSAGAPGAQLLDGGDLDLAVACGASYYGFGRKKGGVRIRGGIANSYYIGVESAMPAIPGMEPPLQALCVAPFGMEEGTSAEMTSREFALVVGEPARFRFLGSSVRKDDEVGLLLEDWEPDELTELPELEVVLPAEELRAGTRAPVTLSSKVTEVGTLEIEAIARDGEKRWKVSLDVRN